VKRIFVPVLAAVGLLAADHSGGSATWRGQGLSGARKRGFHNCRCGGNQRDLGGREHPAAAGKPLLSPRFATADGPMPVPG
jgi:hypothetical protein